MGSHKVVTGKVRLVYLSLKEKSAPPGSDRLRYSVNVLVDKKDKYTLDKLQEAVDAAVADGKKNLWSNKKPIDATLNKILRDRSDDSEAEFWQGNRSIVPKTDYDVKVIDQDNNSVKVEDCYDGMYARVSMSIYPYKHESGGKGLGVQLNSIKMIPGGEKIEISYDPTQDYDDDYEDDYKEEIQEEKPKKKRRRRRNG